MAVQQLAQSVQDDSVPYITVQRDDRGGVCWVVVGMGTEVRCYSGQRALDVLRMICASRGINVPQ
jgi:hypothetical protein